MISYLKNSEISIRIGLNPIRWKWLPKLAYDGPTPFYPKRRTYAFIFLFLQAYLDVDNGTTDDEVFEKLFHVAMDAYEEDELGPKIPRANKTGLHLE